MALLCRWFLLFLGYSVVGWAAETVYCSVPQGRLVERGFLRGPLCPIYGFGALLVVTALTPLSRRPALVFLCGMVLTSALEYLTSFFMEKLFHMRWWDYSHKRFNLNGRVCLLNSVLFGGLCLALMYGLHPWLSHWVQFLPETWLYAVSGALFCVLSVDLILSVKAAVHLDRQLERLRVLQEELSQKLEARRQALEEGLQERREELESVRARAEEVRRQILAHSHLLRAFPDLRSLRDYDLLAELKRQLENRKKSGKGRG